MKIISFYLDNFCNPPTTQKVKRKILRIVVFLCAVMLATSTQAASRVFYDGFESGTTNAWSQDDYHNKCTVVSVAADGGSPRSGSYMLRCNWNGTVAWNDPKGFEALKLNGWNYTSEFLIRFWIRRDANAKDHPSEGPKYYRIGANGSFGAMHFRDGYQKAEFYNSTGGQIGKTFWGSGSKAGNGSWHKVEIYVKNGTSNGVVRLWEDGIKVWEAVNVNTTQTGGSWAQFYISSNWSGAAGCCDHDAINYLYWDDFEIYSDTGTGAIGSLADASISSSTSTPVIGNPSNLKVE